MKQRGRINLRSARDSEARSLYALIAANREEGHLLPRTHGELKLHATRFVVATRGRRIVGCAELATLGPHVAEVRSLAVDARERGKGVGTLIVDELRRRARAEGFEKLTTDCIKCPLFRTCGQSAMVVPLESPYDVDRAPAAVVRYA